MERKTIGLSAIGLLLFSCTQNIENNEVIKKNNTTFSVLSEQYLLTNEISMNNRNVVFGGSSYLINIKNETFLCTAKHLTGSAMGFEPSIDLRTFKDSLNYWKAYPRTNKRSDDTINVSDLLFFDEDYDDIILLNLENKPQNIGVLSPNFTKLKKGTRVRILGCEYEDYDCFQKDYFGTLNSYTTIDQMEIFMDSLDVSISGFSGAPVLDEKNQVVGHVLGGGNFGNGILKIYAAPISLAKKILKKRCL
ncbi:MAG: trypsin-like peptidase domain-containing protein [Crocinitomicaceae bacterium]|nr:serine protease [Flavobacteriales bacterium]NQZ38246.1 trypsin-like peptidase domain-containing protein [Crocinitomicaceae bacterium]